MNVYLYYGADRNRSKKFLSSQDVVITTYNVLSADFGVSGNRVHFSRLWHDVFVETPRSGVFDTFRLYVNTEWTIQSARIPFRIRVPCLQ